ncbi:MULTISPECIES: alpha/beta hydrolase [unclassified Leptolyngbya]|uniref:alpha/beta fold hydrolase n=1 Tax=unclassified Leptolyngbya TaxID=2650499 RepID=UPI001683EECA|nr:MULTISPECIES: alpha/beta hydrolase [unclassified Leptolyngbya]MBD1909074.1 alpha/beta hydrolase [Leptolyngbya sp. FACHB-8]MBD2157146.1 alpha/beta hydrolase [Leptolyngbya sp. FACHB-16]
MSTAALLGHEILGDGPEKVIVMGGWLGDRSVFQPIHLWLDREKFTYCFVDPRGYGESRDIAGEYTFAEIAGDVTALADNLGWNKFHYIGHSMMGKTAQFLCARYGDRLKSAVGVAPVPACKISLDENGYALFSSAWEVPANRGIICTVTTGSRHTPKWEQFMISESLRTTTPEAYRAYFHTWSGEDFAEEVQGCPVPFLALTGEYDAGVPTEFVKGTILEWFPKAELHVMSNAGHYPMVETPIQFVTVCEAFMARWAA